MKILVSGLLNIETTVAVRGFPIEYYPIDYSFFGVNSGVGGVGYNIARALKTLGDDVCLTSFLGDDDEGERIVTNLGKDGISADLISRDIKATPTSAVLFDEDGRRQIYCDLKDIQEKTLEPSALDSELKSCEIVAICNINFNRELIKRAKKNGVTVATDVHVLSDIDDEYNRDFMENADILFLSDEKLPCPAPEFIDKLSARYNSRVIVIGMGSKGALLCDRTNGKTYALKPYKAEKIVNTVGAGDALFSAFLHFFSKGLSPLDALMRAEVFAGVKIAANGASKGFCTESEVEAKLSAAPIEFTEFP